MRISQAIDVTEFIDARPLSSYQCITIILCAFVAMLDGYDTQSIAFVAPVISAQWDMKVSAFGPIFGAGLFGLMIGAMTLGPAADRFGRKPATVVATAVFGIFALLTVTATSFNELLLFRVLTGFGLGGAMPNLIAITSEYSPARLRATTQSLMFCGFPLGAVLGGAVASKMIAAFGWQSVFYVGGVLPILMVPVLLAMLPESIRFLTSKDRTRDVSRMLRRIDKSATIPLEQHFVLEEDNVGGTSIVQLFRDHRASMTGLLWLAFFMTLLVLYFLADWLPAVLREAGLPLDRAIIATAVFYAGGIVGSLSMAHWIDRGSPYRVLPIAYIGAAAFTAAIGAVGDHLVLLMLTVFAAGYCVIGAMISLNYLAAASYPTAIRSTGVGWALGVGRVGSIVGPVVGGILISTGIDTLHLFVIGAMPALLAGAAIFLIPQVGQRPAAVRSVV
jgi:AAHS family 4-hydroxybenzoate transporter-like MFS transporter